MVQWTRKRSRKRRRKRREKWTRKREKHMVYTTYNRWKYGCMSAVRGVWSERTDVQQRVK